jgi:WD40 repeat protein/serine/threonine protein kinase
MVMEFYPRTPCLERSEIERYVREELPPEERARADAHLDACPMCAEILMELEFAGDGPSTGKAASRPERSSAGAAERRIGTYRVIRELGRGGQGQVYLAEDRRLGRKVALKLLPQHLTQSSDILLRFQREAAALAKLNHPGICAVYETGSHEGAPYIAMQFIEGTSLAGVIAGQAESHRAGTPSPGAHVGRMTRIFERAARALHSAHEAGLVHRDIKPGNILITREDDPVILDFGLAHHEGGSLPRLTRTGELMGTPAYMSPEQVGAEPLWIDRRTDVYSLGIALYEALTFRLPFEAPTVAGIYTRILRDSAPDPRRLNCAIRTDLKVILETALEKDRTRRYQTALDLAEDLRRHRQHETIRARPAGPMLRLRRLARRNPAITVALVSLFLILATALGVSLVLLDRVRSERDARQVVLTRLEIQRADDFLAAGNASAGIAYLCDVLRADPSHRVAAERLVSAMVYRKFALPISPPLRHAGAVFTAQFSPDGRLVLTASADSTARLWDAVTGMPAGQPLRHDGEVHHAGFSRDGALAATASKDGTARVWDGRTGSPVSGLLRHGGPVVHAAFSSDGRRLATASRDNTARLWDARSGEPLSPPLAHGSPCLRLEFAPDGQRLLTISEDSLARLWELGPTFLPARELQAENKVMSAAFSPRGTQVLMVLEGGGGILWDLGRDVRLGETPRASRPVVHAAFSPDGLRVVTASWDHTARCFDAASLEPLGAAMRHGNPVSSAEFSPDGLRVVTASEDSTARVWEARTGQALTEPIPHGSRVWQARFSPEGRRVVTACADGTARVWLVAGRGAQPDILCHSGDVVTAAFSPQGDRLLTCSHDLTARVWDAETARPLRAPFRQRDILHHGAFSPDGKHVVTASADRTARIWDVESGAPSCDAFEHEGGVTFADFSPDGRLLATASAGAAVRVWRLETGALAFPPLTQAGAATLARFSPDGSLLATAAEQTPVRLYDSRAGTLLHEADLHRSEVITLGFSPDGLKLVTCSRDNTARILDVRSREADEPLRHGNWVWDAAFSPDAALLATASADATVRIWRVKDGRPFLDPLRHDASVLAVRFSRDGERLLTATEAGTLRLWDTRTGLPSSEALEQPGPVFSARFDPAGERILSASSDQAARLWALPRPPLPVPSRILGLAEDLAAGWPGGRPRPPAEPAGGEIDAEPGGPFYAALEHWILDERPERPAHPALERSVLDQVRALVEGDNLLHLEGGILLAPDRPEVAAALAGRKLLEGRALGQPPLEEARSHLEWAVRIGAGGAEALWARSKLLVLEGKPAPAPEGWLAPAREASSSAWRVWGEALEGAGRLDEALDAYGHAVERAGDVPGPERLSRHARILASRLLRKQGKIEEATSVFASALRLPPRLPATPASCLDLTSSYNASLTNSILMPPELDLAGNDLSGLPAGLLTLAGVEFDVRGMIQTDRKSEPEACLPLAVRGIGVGLKCRRLHFLHTAGWDVDDGTLVGRYILRYEGGAMRELPVVMGEDILEFWYPQWVPREDAGKVVVAWCGTNLHSRLENTSIWLHRRTWENPLPDLVVESVDIVSTASGVSPVVLAITVE